MREVVHIQVIDLGVNVENGFSKETIKGYF